VEWAGWWLALVDVVLWLGMSFKNKKQISKKNNPAT